MQKNVTKHADCLPVSEFYTYIYSYSDANEKKNHAGQIGSAFSYFFISYLCQTTAPQNYLQTDTPWLLSRGMQ